MQWIDQVLKSYGNAIAASDSAGWQPFDYFGIWPYYAQLWMDRLWTAYEKAQEKKLEPNDLTKCFLGPLFLRQELVNVMFYSKSCGYDKEKTTKLLNWLNSILIVKCSEDPYGFNSTKILSGEDVAYLLKMFPLRPVDEKEGKEVGKLIHACEELAWSYFFDWNYWQCFEVYGPYELPNNRKMMLRAFTDFAPSEVWPTATGFEPSTVYIYTIYQATDVKLDYWSHVITQDNLPEKMTNLMIIKHGKILDTFDEMVELRKQMEIAAVMQGKRFKDLSFEEQKAKEIETHCYVYRDLFTKLELDWRPTNTMLESVKNKPPLAYKTPEFKTAEERKEFWIKLHDPREAFFPEELKIKT